MLLECAIIAGVTGVEFVKNTAVAAAVVTTTAIKDEKKQKELRADLVEIVKNLNDSKGEVCSLFILCGERKIKCIREEIEPFILTYNNLIKDDTKGEVWNRVNNAFSKKELESYAKLIKGASGIPIGDDAHLKALRTGISQKADVLWSGSAFFGEDYISNHSTFNKLVKDNKTIQWILFPYSKEFVNRNNQEPVYNGKISDLVLAASGFWHSLQTEAAYRKVLKDEDEKKNLAIQIEDAYELLVPLKEQLNDIIEVLEKETNKLNAINERMSKIAEFNNTTDYAYDICAEIINDGITVCRDLFPMIANSYFDNEGRFSQNLSELFADGLFRERILSEKGYEKFDVYYQKFVRIYPITEVELSDNNIKIIDSELFGDTAKYMHYRKKDEEAIWKDCNLESALRYDKRYARLSADTIQEVVKLLRDDLSLGIQKTTMYYYGNKDIFDDLSKCITEQYINVKPVDMGDGRYEK